jgi:hypothetical protein
MAFRTENSCAVQEYRAMTLTAVMHITGLPYGGTVMFTTI